MESYGNNQQPDDRFVAIDVEYADTKEQHICQVGLAVVCNMKIVDRKVWLIQPPRNYYEDIPMSKHHITPETTANERTFEQVWPEIYEYLKGKILWAHNAASTEIPVINKNIEYSNKKFGTQFEYIHWINDSRELYKRPDCPPNSGNKLPLCCMALSIPFDDKQYHDAEYDAVKCAEIVIAHQEGIAPDWTGVPKSGEELRKKQQKKKYLQMGQFQEYANRIETAKKKLKSSKTKAVSAQLDLFSGCPGTDSGSLLLTAEEEELLNYTDIFAIIASTRDGAETHQVDVFDNGDRMSYDGHDSVDYSRLQMSEDNPLYGVKVAVTGFFHIGRKDLLAALEAKGAKVTSSVAKTTAALLIGNRNVGLPKLAAMEKLMYNGFVIPLIVDDDDLDELLYGNARLFHIGENSKPRKKLNFTVKHFRDNHLKLAYPVNTISNRELYFPPTGLMGRMDCFCQICGNLGAFGNWEYYSDVNLVVLPNSSVETLQRGEKDDVIRDFENYYNSQRSVVFDAEFITERDILKFARERIIRCDDVVTADLYVKYLESAGIDPENDFKYGIATARKEYEKELCNN